MWRCALLCGAVYLVSGCDAAPGTAPVTAIRPIAAASLPRDAELSCQAIDAGITQTSERLGQNNARRRQTLSAASDDLSTPAATGALERINRLILLGRSKGCFA